MIRICNADGSIKKLVNAKTFDELIKLGKQKLNILENVALTIRMEDGFEIDDDDGLQFAIDEKAVLHFYIIQSININSSSISSTTTTTTTSSSSSSASSSSSSSNTETTAAPIAQLKLSESKSPLLHTTTTFPIKKLIKKEKLSNILSPASSTSPAASLESVTGGGGGFVTIKQQSSYDESSTEQQSTSCCAAWPSVYQLPDLTDTLQNYINNEIDGRKLRSNSTFTNSLLRLIFRDVLRFVDPASPYLEPYQYSAVVNAISLKYPILTDNGTEEIKRFWRRRLIRRFKDYRASLTPNDMLLCLRQKYGKKRSRPLLWNVSTTDDLSTLPSLPIDRDSRMSSNNNNRIIDDLDDVDMHDANHHLLNNLLVTLFDQNQS